MRNASFIFLVLAVIANLVIGDQSRIHGKHFWQEEILDPKKYLEKIYEYYVAGKGGVFFVDDINSII